MARFGVDVAALSETRLADVGGVEEIGSGYTFYWQGKEANNARICGVGFAVKTEIVRRY